VKTETATIEKSRKSHLWPDPHPFELTIKHPLTRTLNKRSMRLECAWIWFRAGILSSSSTISQVLTSLFPVILTTSEAALSGPTPVGGGYFSDDRYVKTSHLVLWNQWRDKSIWTPNVAGGEETGWKEKTRLRVVVLFCGCWGFPACFKLPIRILMQKVEICR